MRRAVWCVLLVACRFQGPDVAPSDSGPGDAAGGDAAVDARIDAPSGGAPWWDAGYGHRRRLAVTTGAVRPDKGYAGYTVRLAFDPAALTGLGPSCDDLRVATYDGQAWTERARHVASCAAGAGDLRFALPADIADGATWGDAYLYYARAAPPAPLPAVGPAVYLWWDPAASDRSGSFTTGRMDPWNGTGHRPSVAWSATDAAYAYDTTDDAQESLRRAVDERDVLVEAEWRHTGCYNTNMQSGVCARVITMGAAAGETADHYYCTSRAQHPSCSDADQGIYDGDIVKTDNEIIAVQGTIDPPPIVPNQWRKQALAVFGTAPARLRFWDADASWPGLATPPPAALQAMGDDATDYAGRGAAGVMLSQDIGQVRNFVVRRYVEPEPAVALGAEESAP